MADEKKDSGPGPVAEWPLSECGLPPRIVNALAAMHLRRVRELRAAWQTKLRGIGPSASRTLQDFLRLCDLAESGTVQALPIGEILEALFPRRTCELLVLRYGLKSEFSPSSNACVTLQEAGRRLGLVRERVRQLESGAKRILRARPARACLAAVRQQFESCITSFGGIADGHEVRTWFPAETMPEYHPAAVLQLCCDCQTWFHFYRGLFSRYSADILRVVESTALRELEAAKTLLTIRDLANRISWPIPLATPARERILTCLLPRVPRAVVTLHGDAFHAGRGLPALLASYLQANGPLEAVAIYNGINATLLPGGRQSKQSILFILRHDPRFVSIAGNRYSVMGGVT